MTTKHQEPVTMLNDTETVMIERDAAHQAVVGGFWFRAHGNENWEFADNGLMSWRQASINDLPIDESERKFRWER